MEHGSSAKVTDTEQRTQKCEERKSQIQILAFGLQQVLDGAAQQIPGQTLQDKGQIPAGSRNKPTAPERGQSHPGPEGLG